MEMKEFKTGWIKMNVLTRVRRLSEYNFEVLHGQEYDDFVVIEKHEIDVAPFIEDEQELIDTYCSQNGYHSIQELTDEYGDEYLQVIAEFIAHEENDYEKIATVKNEDLAEAFLNQYTLKQGILEYFYRLKKDHKSSNRDKCMRLSYDEICVIFEGLSKLDGVDCSKLEAAYQQHQQEVDTLINEREDSEANQEN